MVLNYYRLREQPFGVTPDARFLYLSATHREALASLLYGVSAERGFVALIAKPGMGKTTLLFQSLAQLQATARTVFLFQTISTPMDFLRALLNDLGLDTAGNDLIEMQSKLNHVLLEQSRSGKRLIVFIDEAQNLDGPVFELVRMLSNFESSREKLMQIILAGQPQLAEKLGSANLEQLRQRISVIAQLKPFSEEETKLYIQHRLLIAGYNSNVPLFSSAALGLIARRSGGIPRNINNLCFHALSLGCALKRRTIDAGIVLEALGDLDLDSLREQGAAPPQRPKKPASAAIGLALSMVAARIRTSRILKSGGAAIALVALGWGLSRVHTAQKGATEVQAKVEARSIARATSSRFGAASAQVPFTLVRVRPGETLCGICMKQFGRCSAADLRRIRRLNPWLDDPEHIESGEEIRISAEQSPLEPSSSKPVVEAARQ